MNHHPPSEPLRTAVLFIAFNRYDSARAVMEAIREARPPRLYFACDGPRSEEERSRCERVRSLVELVDWDCELRTRFLDENLGVKYGESTAMQWFFDHEEEGIVLEDDTHPQQSFFWFCQEMLERYRHDDRVWVVMGNNLMTEWPLPGEESYYFSAHGYGAYWGWAGWRRVWNKYDVEIADWPEVRDRGLLDGHFLTRGEQKEVRKLMEYTWNGTIRSWDYQFDLGRILNHAVAIMPRVNMIRNIGFGADGTHTVSEKDRRNKDSVGDMAWPLVHPRHMLVDAERDKAYFRKYIEPTAFRKFKNAVSDMLPERVNKAITPVLSDVQRKLGIS